MGGRCYVLVATFLCLMSISYSTEKRATFVQHNEADWRTSNTMSHEGSGHGPADKGGGGGGEGEDDEDDDQGWPSYDGSADNDGEEGSGYDDTEGSAMSPVVLTPCQQLKHRLELQKQLKGAYIPRCTNTGEFQPKQCDQQTNDCWCVDRNGSEIPGSRRNKPANPQCSLKGRDGWHLPEEKEKDTYGTVMSPVDTNDGFEIDKPKELEPEPDITETEPDPEMDWPESGDQEPRREQSRSSFILKPGLLAGIIGGAVVGLLCAVLLVMFVVYRMRKKDEGSYPLDEPKKPLNYTKTQHNQEYFA